MKIDPYKTAVLVIDMQRDLYGEGGSAVLRGRAVNTMQALVEKINSFTTEMRSKGLTVVYTKFIYDPARSPKNYIEMIENSKGANYMCRVDTAGAKLDGVSPESEDVVIEKYSYDAFAGTGLKDLLDQKGIENVIITGVRTEVCVLATASRSFAEGYRTYVVSDLVATYDDKQDIADAILEGLKYSATILTQAELDGELVHE